MNSWKRCLIHTHISSRKMSDPRLFSHRVQDPGSTGHFPTASALHCIIPNPHIIPGAPRCLDEEWEVSVPKESASSQSFHRSRYRCIPSLGCDAAAACQHINQHVENHHALLHLEHLPYSGDSALCTSAAASRSPTRFPCPAPLRECRPTTAQTGAACWSP